MEHHKDIEKNIKLELNDDFLATLSQAYKTCDLDRYETIYDFIMWCFKFAGKKNLDL